MRLRKSVSTVRPVWLCRPAVCCTIMSTPFPAEAETGDSGNPGDGAKVPPPLAMSTSPQIPDPGCRLCDTPRDWASGWLHADACVVGDSGHAKKSVGEGVCELVNTDTQVEDEEEDLAADPNACMGGV
mmetsp:Transcript_24343/g.47785  ORF Transcript_24343/g.47785 Transcript_24343/m.47785 type:complete len:128 (+) Transcript_24343:271-654(+)